MVLRFLPVFGDRVFTGLLRYLLYNTSRFLPTESLP
jgi:hypothetical protein